MPRQTWLTALIAFAILRGARKLHTAFLAEIPECIVVAVYSPVAAGGIAIVSPIDQAS